MSAEVLAGRMSGAATGPVGSWLLRSSHSPVEYSMEIECADGANACPDTYG